MMSFMQQNYKETLTVVVSKVKQKGICKCAKKSWYNIDKIYAYLPPPISFPPITACFQSLRSCSFSKCFLTGNCDYKDM